ncbi:PREDICTED: uncharacterized protein LOC109472701 isoform X2 [Branchiostoma belcheri]|uniref:Uncharacterized protein LOC109472701 isoform X2 n=1 Tax=Branchiostoma belcheri TaxID=7741 RepID=A0A6P4YUU5_BRABE|nr:PREDICTED: uncharacterized protein LOC109472701 isoform X2 [Branchiostoma belcheri]
MAILQHCCCGCCSLRVGCYWIASTWMTMQIAGIASAAKNIVSTTDGAVPVSDAVNIAIYSVGIIIDILLFIGVMKEKKELLLSWVIFSVCCTLASLGVAIYVTVVWLGVIHASGDASELAALLIGPFLAGAWIIWGFVALITAYGCLVVYSHYQNLRDGVVEGGQPGMVMTVQAPQPGLAPGAAVQSQW